MAAHWFSTNNTQSLLANKKVVIIGDSVQRSVYKDLVCLLKANQLLKPGDLRRKGEDSFEGDQLIEGGNKAGLKTVEYKEVRKFTKGSTVITFYFVTRCFGEYLKSIIASFETAPPDIIIMNSCLWDLSRYGKDANSKFKTNISELLEAMGLVMPCDSKRMFIWNATLPVIDSSKASCIPFDFPQAFRPENKNVRNANLFVRDQMVDYGNHFVFLDLYNIFNGHLNHRIHDGVHWDEFAHRKITNLLLSKISAHWDFELPAKENGPPVPPGDSRSTPSTVGRRSMSFLPNHSSSPYQRPSPSTINQVHHSLRQSSNPLTGPFLANTRAPMSGQSSLGWRRPMPRSPFPCLPGNFLTSPFSPRPRPYNFERDPCHRRTSPLNVYNGPLFHPGFANFFSCTFPPVVRKRKWEEENYSASMNGYKRPRKFL